MKTRLAISLAAVSLLASSAAFAQSTTEEGARNGARAGGDIGGPVGAMVGGTVGAAVGAGLEIPNAILGGIPRDERRAKYRDCYRVTLHAAPISCPAMSSSARTIAE